MVGTAVSHDAFKLIREQQVESLNVVVQEFEHTATGAQHIHLKSDSNENVFLVALRTVPHDSTGVAHILEHTALCGSKKYPVRDPFFMMTRRSLNTFMNAFTSSDWTAYPFASMNKKDFNNLLDVYLDAVFFSRLDKLDFAQEGHRFEFSEMENSNSDLQYKGVVYNEMKGAMSSVPSQLWQTLCKYLFPTTTYHHNSGGEPEHIPDLSYEELVEFYKTHYHPSNAIFMTFGDIPASEHQRKFHEQALDHFEKLDYTITVDDEKRYYAPVRVQESYPNNDNDLSNKTHVVMGWLLGSSTNLEETLRAQLLSSVLLDNSATPLMLAIETTDLGTAPSPLCGLDDSQKELTFMCGLAGCKEHDADKIEQLIRDVLNDVAENGIPIEDIESALHQLELHQREIGGDSYPYGLQLIMTALTSATHRGDPVKLLNIDPVLEKLREEIKQPNFIQDLVKKYLINNNHNVRLLMTPNASINEDKENREREILASIKSQLSDKQKHDIIDQSIALKERQVQIDDESILPKVTLADVPKQENFVEGQKVTALPTITQYPTGTNGLVYQQFIYDLPKLDENQTSLLALYANIVTELGVGEKSYLDIQKQQAKICGSFSAFNSIRSDIDDKHRTSNFFGFSGKALNRNQLALTEIMQETINNARFDEADRIKELVSHINTSNEQRVTNNGHILAMTAASSGFCAAANLSHSLSGLLGYKSFKSLNHSLSNSEHLSALTEDLSDIHKTITGNSSRILLIGEENELPKFTDNIAAYYSPTESQSLFELNKIEQKTNEAWLTNTQVNFCARAYPTVTMTHPDAPALVVLGGFLRNSFLHTKIREQGGAYGGGASQENNIGAFRFYSYRDPRLEETLTDFEQSIDWLLNENHASCKLEEAVLGAVSNLDRSESPAGQAKRCYWADLHGRTVQLRQAYRERLISVTLDDIKRVAAKYLTEENANTAIITDISQKDRVLDLGLTAKEI